MQNKQKQLDAGKGCTTSKGKPQETTAQRQARIADQRAMLQDVGLRTRDALIAAGVIKPA